MGSASTGLRRGGHCIPIDPHYLSWLADARVLVLGVAYKQNVNDTRHSPAERIIRLPKQKGVDDVRYHDPHVPSFQIRGPDEGVLDIPRTELTPKTLQAVDATLVVTAHDVLDADMIARNASHIVDTRNAGTGVE